MTAPPFGFYGKLPSQGDFVGRRLPWDLTQAWDGWMQRGIQAAREQLGSGWLDAYLSAPVWRFRLAPGLMSDSGWVGLWFASVDRVGRHFPLMVAAPWWPSAGAAPLVSEPDTYWQRLEDRALMALDPRTTLDQFDQLVQDQPLPAFGPTNPSTDAISIADDAVAPGCDDKPLQAMPAVAGTALRLRLLPADTSPIAALQACTAADSAAMAFFSWGCERLPVSVLSASTLPGADAFSGFLTGQWPTAQCVAG